MNTGDQTDDMVQEICINATAERIFQALTNPVERAKWWWRAEGRFIVTDMESDLRPGGKWAMRGVGMGEKIMTVSGEYREIISPTLLVHTWLPDWQENMTETVLRWELDEKDGVTTLRLTHSGFTDETTRGVYRGWPLVLGGLRKYVEGSD